MRISLTIVMMLLVCSSEAFGQRTWNNSANDNDFANGANWGGWTGSFTGSNQEWWINSIGDDRAEINSAIGGVQRDVFVGSSNASNKGELFIGSGGSINILRDFLVGDNGSEGTLFIEGGTVDVFRNLRMGRSGGLDGFGIVTMGAGGTGGTLNIGSNLFVGQSNRAQNVFTLDSGTVTIVGTLNVAHNSDLQANLIVNNGSLTAGNALFADGNEGVKSASLTVTGGSFATTSGSIDFGNSAGGANATVNLSGDGSITAATNVRVGFGSNSVTNFNISGGSLNAAGFITMGQGAGASVTVDMTGGSINADRLIFANNESFATLNMTGGSFNLAAVADGGTQTTKGALVMSSAGAALNIGGNAVVNAEKLYINSGGLLTLSGDALIDIAGSTDGSNPTFDFAQQFLLGDWSGTAGSINFSSLGSLLRVAGDGETFLVAGSGVSVNFVDLFNEAIANNVFTHSVGGGSLSVGFDGTYSFVQAVPEPSSLALLGVFGCLLGLSRHRRDAADLLV
jgi:hypothetical protein